MNRVSVKSGMTLIETLIAVAIVALVLTAASVFQKNVFSMNTVVQSGITFQIGARAALRAVTSEVREASPSSLGSFPIESAATSSLVFFSDIDDDGLKERVRYFLSGTDFKKGVVKPSGLPLAYDLSTEILSTVLTGIINGTSTPAFTYYDKYYNGTSTPLAFPVAVSAVRLVKIRLVSDENPNRAPGPLEFTTQISIRNLKDNL